MKFVNRTKFPVLLFKAKDKRISEEYCTHKVRFYIYVDEYGTRLRFPFAESRIFTQQKDTCVWFRCHSDPVWLQPHWRKRAEELGETLVTVLQKEVVMLTHGITGYVSDSMRNF